MSEMEKIQFQSQKNSQNSEKTLFNPQFCQKRNPRGPRKGSKRKLNTAVGITAGPWNLSQMNSYLKFLLRFTKDFKNKEVRKKKKIFFRMASFIKSRTSEQCRSHHQKLQIKFQSIEAIINYIKNVISELSKNLDKFSDKKEEDIFSQIPVKNQLKTLPHIQKTSMNQQTFYEIKETRSGLIIFFQQEFIQEWS